MTEPTGTDPLRPWHVTAVNNARQSDNPIHDDAVAGRFGFAGGLVPGVDVYGYMAHLPVGRWGRAWLERGYAECRFLKPVYDGDRATARAAETAAGLELEVECRGEPCAVGLASLPDIAPAIPAFAEPEPPPPPAVLPPAGEATLAPGRVLAIRPVRVGADEMARYLRDLGENLALYTAEGLVHPAVILGLGNWVLKDNVILGPWMHVGSRVQHFAAARIGDELTARGLVTANYEKKGHAFVECDVLVWANRRTPIARMTHISIWRPRPMQAHETGSGPVRARGV